jgi:hypothetical protein
MIKKGDLVKCHPCHNGHSVRVYPYLTPRGSWTPVYVERGTLGVATYVDHTKDNLEVFVNGNIVQTSIKDWKEV